MANVLIVDDDPALREGLSEALTDLGHAPQTASTGTGVKCGPGLAPVNRLGG